MKWTFLLYLSLTILLVFSSCSTLILNKKVNLKALDKDTPVEVYEGKSPFYRYKILCSAKLKDKGSSQSNNLNHYIDEAKYVARKCGHPQALLKVELNGDIFVYIIEMKDGGSKFLENKELAKELTSAVLKNDVQEVYFLLKDMKINPLREKRNTADSEILDEIMRTNAEKGDSCSKKTLNFLDRKYQVRVNAFKDFSYLNKGRKVSKRVDTLKIFECYGHFLRSSLKDNPEKDEALEVLYNEVKKRSSYGLKREEDQKIYKSFMLFKSYYYQNRSKYSQYLRIKRILKRFLK